MKMLPLILASLLIIVNADFHLKPILNEALIGETTYFDCITTTHTNAVHWYHYRVEAKHHEDICVYCLGKIHPQYQSRFEVERILGTDIYRLIIKSVQLEDAGIYICQDNGGIGESLSAELVVLESAPICQTNMETDGLLGENDCDMGPDVLQMSCSILYRGNIRPTIQWREVHSAEPIKKGVSCTDKNYRLTCNLTVKARVGIGGYSYTCETPTSATKQYNCSSGVIDVIHVNINHSLVEMDFDSKKTVHCLANSSQPCSYSWKWFDGVNEVIVSNGAVLTPSKAGWHKCEAACAIHGNQCTVLSYMMHVSEQTMEINLEPVVGLVIGLTLMIFLMIIIPVIIHVLLKRRRKQHRAFFENKNVEQTKPFLQGVDEPILAQILIIRKASSNRNKAVFGMAILGDELFVLCSESPTLEVYADLQKLELRKEFDLTRFNLEDPWDIQSCPKYECLYIADKKKDEANFTEIIKIDPVGNFQRKWTAYCIAGRLSVTYESNIIVTSLNGPKIEEYSPDGTLIRSIYLPSDYGFSNPWVTLKRSDNEYMISHGSRGDKQHRVCICSVYGAVKQYFGGLKGLSNHQLNTPVHMAAYSDGHLLVADKDNSRVVLLSPDLKFLQAISLDLCESAYSRYPNRICLDETNKRIFVSHNRWTSNMKPCNDGQVSVFDMSNVQTMFKIALTNKLNIATPLKYVKPPRTPPPKYDTPSNYEIKIETETNTNYTLLNVLNINELTPYYNDFNSRQKL